MKFIGYIVMNLGFKITYSKLKNKKEKRSRNLLCMRKKLKIIIIAFKVA